MRPSYQGHVTLQGGFPLLDAYKLQEPGLPEKAELEKTDHPRMKRRHSQQEPSTPEIPASF